MNIRAEAGEFLDDFIVSAVEMVDSVDLGGAAGRRGGARRRQRAAGDASPRPAIDQARRMIVPTASATVPHNLGREAARSRLTQFVDRIRQKYGDQVENLAEDLSGEPGTFSFTYQGLEIKGTLVVEETAVTVACQLPFLAAMFKDRIESGLREQLAGVLQ